jgi:addiction module HigA family antidote
MKTQLRNPSHPGEYIKEHVIPKGVTVKNAAELLAVGRPALSNLLNGNAALTPEMAVRLEKAFGADSQTLLSLQAKYDEHRRLDSAKEIAVRTYVPGFVRIEARQITAWSEQTPDRAELPALLRRLVCSTGAQLSKVDLPAYDNAQRPGWDGFVSADAAMPWVPRGDSGWEFGCDRTPARKAEDDYRTRTVSVPPEQRKNTTFIFVTPRNWPGKVAWAEAKRREGRWKDVRAYDASDLEQWIEQSIPAQAWFGERVGNGAPGISSLDECWREWAEVTDPPLSKVLFRSAIETNRGKITNWLSQPPHRPLVVGADSEAEALAFVACGLEALGDNPGQFFDRAVVLRNIEALKRAVASAAKFIAVVSSSDVEHASAGLQKANHMLVVRRRNEILGDPDIALGLVDHQTFRDALTSMGIPWGEQERYVRETAHSPTILRRRLSHLPAIRTPAWSANRSLARKLIPLNLAGVWNSENAADREIMRLLAEAEYTEIETAITDLSVVPDAPVWSIGNFRGVASKIDVLFSTHLLVTREDLDNFFIVAEYVLSESDPALDLSPDKQWAANLYGNSRDHSSVLRRGLCETLVLLAVHGNTLFGGRLGINVEARVNALVQALLTPLDARTWASQKHDLPRYAEAAPNAFLDIVEEDLRSAKPQIYELLRPADSSPFSDCPRAGLLWALETLAWKPERLVRVSLVLAKLATLPIADNWGNKPEGSLDAIFRCFMPQTAASIDERNKALEILCERFPVIGWRVCMDQFGPGSQTGDYSSRPAWRNDAVGAGEPVKTIGEIHRAAQKALQLALAWPRHDEETLSDLVKRLQGISEPDREIVWGLVRGWAASNPTDAAKHKLRECIRTFAFTRQARARGLPSAIKDRAREAYGLLEIADPIMRHLWLFARSWVDESADELEDNDFDYHKHEARIAAQREAALSDIWAAADYSGIMRLCDLGEASSAIGWLLAERVITNEGGRIDFLRQLAGQPASPAELKIDNLISGFLGRLEPETRDRVIDTAIDRLMQDGGCDNKIIRILKCAPFRAETWKHLDALSTDLQRRYWRETYVRWERQDEVEINTLIDRLLEVRRPRAAFEAVHMDFKKVETKSLIALMRAVAASSAEPAEHFRFSAYEISNAFKTLSDRPDMPRDELAQLEFVYAEVLEHSEYGIPTLEQELTKQPHLFIQLVALVYRRNDNGTDPPDWVIDDEERRSGAATTAYNVLRRASRIPGTLEDGSIDGNDLLAWVQDVRESARLYGRVEVTDHAIGGLLAHCPPDPDGTWPCKPVRSCLEAIASQNIAEGVRTGRYNLRGVHWRGEGGQQERDLAAQYRGWSKAVAFEFPFTAKLLEQLAITYDSEAVWQDTDSNVRRRLTS